MGPLNCSESRQSDTYQVTANVYRDLAKQVSDFRAVLRSELHSSHLPGLEAYNQAVAVAVAVAVAAT
jgi:hypothetical protein